jgi:ABC-type transport system substrate-binding protein
VNFTITSYPTTEGKRTVEAIQSQLNQYPGVHVEVEVLDFPGAIGKTVQRSFQFITSGLYPGTDPSLALWLGLYGSSPGNLSGAGDAQLDSSLLKGLAATDDADRAAAFQETGKLFQQLAPGVIYTRYVLAMGLSPKVHGMELYANAALRTDTVWIEH